MFTRVQISVGRRDDGMFTSVQLHWRRERIAITLVDSTTVMKLWLGNIRSRQPSVAALASSLMRQPAGTMQ